jgi:hypothetical protein
MGASAAAGALASGMMRHGGIGACPMSGDEGCRTGFAAIGAFGASGAVALVRSGCGATDATTAPGSVALMD